jgi:hypothetical protein
MSSLTQLEVSENSGYLELSLRLTGESEETATQINSVGQGMISLLQLQKDKPQNAKLLDAIKLKQQGNVVTLTVSMPEEDVIAMGKAAARTKHRLKAKSEDVTN